MKTYYALLTSNPGDTAVLQRVEELKSLLKLLGKDKEEMVARLETFLKGIRKRRDELSGSA
jgi:tryptophanyl-tRNA synthetase